ncbi:MAG: HupE/UreJ family protein [Capsulimonadales bacterium]|nr:HupE/UreJ family protein [Capsulimonadales bacterium]
MSALFRPPIGGVSIVRTVRCFIGPLIGLFVLLFALPAGAHQFQVEPVSVTIRPQATFIHVEFVGNVQDITQAVTVQDSEKRGDEFAPEVLQRMTEYLNGHLFISQNGEALPATVTVLRFQSGLDPTQARFRMVARYPRAIVSKDAEKAPITITSNLFDYLPNAVSMVTVSGLVHKLVSGDPTKNSATIDPSAFASNLFRNIRDFLILGAEHIVTGPDHILFILAFLLVAPNLPSLIRTLTGFTIAHSITLVLSTLGIVQFDARIVDIAVAASIVYVGAENFFLKDMNRRFWVASGFGLVHGLAFAGNLRDAGLPEGSALFWSLLSFNLGVEIAQVILCLIAFPLVTLWRTGVEKRARSGAMTWPAVIRVTSAGVIIAGVYWLIQRAFGSA